MNLLSVLGSMNYSSLYVGYYKALKTRNQLVFKLF
nr:MAG TPA: hypothetical protein [Caudoviricetes sp.]